MKKEKYIMKLLSEITDPFIYKVITTQKMTEKEIVKLILKKMNAHYIDTKKIMILLQYFIDKIDEKNEFFDEEIKKCIILKGDYIIMSELLRHSEINIFNKEELQQIYKEYNNYEIRTLVEAKLWASL